MLVNNAGFTTVGDVHLNPDRQLGMVHVNVEALVDLDRQWLPGMVDRGAGAVINVASIGVLPADPRAGGLRGHEGVRAQLQRGGVGGGARHGVTVTRLCPGPVATEFVEAGGFKNQSPGPSFVFSPPRMSPGPGSRAPRRASGS